jgi:hypothetical protein
MSLVLRDPFLEKDLTERARQDLDYWRSLLEPLLRQPGEIKNALAAIARSSGQRLKTVRNRYYAARKHGLLGLVDKRIAGPRFWRLIAKSTPPVSKSRGIQQLWKALCEKNQRKCRPQFKQLVQMWKDRDARIGATPEYADFPGWPALPSGWTYRNFMRYAPAPFELDAARVGPAFAAARRRTVFTTRVGCYVGSHLMLDDKWNNLFVNSFAEMQAGRPLEIYSLDYFSARKCRWATRVRTKDQQGNYAGIPETMARFVLAAHLHLDGYSPRGTVVVAEAGTAAVAERVAVALHDHSGGLISLSEGAVRGQIAHLGQYPGIERGNPRHKAALESNNSREHNAFAALPGQTGKDVEHRPEQLDGRAGLLSYNARLLKAYSLLPAEKAALLEFPILELNQYLALADHIYKLLEDDRDHELEGWIEAGNVVQAYELGGQWILETQLTAQQRAAVPLMLDAGLLNARPMRMSRREVWDRGAGDLVRLPGWGVCDILGDDLAREVSVTDGMISVENSEWWPGVYRFATEGRDAEGRMIRLPEGEKFQAFINPFAAGALFVRDAKGRYVGEMRRIHAPSRADMDGVRRAMGAAAHEEAQLLAPLVARHDQEAREKLRRHQQNARTVGPDLPPKPSAAQQATNAERLKASAARSRRLQDMQAEL